MHCDTSQNFWASKELLYPALGVLESQIHSTVSALTPLQLLFPNMIVIIEWTRSRSQSPVKKLVRLFTGLFVLEKPGILLESNDNLNVRLL